MDIPTYRAQQGLSQSGFAAELTAAGSPATQSLVSQWETGAVKVPPERWSAIERVTDGAVTREELRPDIFAQPVAREA